MRRDRAEMCVPEALTCSGILGPEDAGCKGQQSSVPVCGPKPAEKRCFLLVEATTPKILGKSSAMD